MNGVLTGENSDSQSRVRQMEDIVAQHETGLLRYATRILNNSFEAQDVVQNVFIKLFKTAPDSLPASGQLRSWLYRVTHNEAVDHIRHDSRLHLLHEKQAEERLNECPDGRNCALTDQERHELALAHLSKLDPREQQVVYLRLEEGLSYKEISAATGRSEGNVGNILHHAVRKLAMSLKKAGVTTS